MKSYYYIFLLSTLNYVCVAQSPVIKHPILKSGSLTTSLLIETEIDSVKDVKNVFRQSKTILSNKFLLSSNSEVDFIKTKPYNFKDSVFVKIKE